MALLDIIREKLQTPKNNIPAGPQADQTQTVRSLLQAKTGKQQATTPGPQQSSLQEQIAKRGEQVGMQQLQQTGQMQAEQFKEREADIAQRSQQQEQGFKQSLSNLAQSQQIDTNRIINQFASGQKQLATEKDLADLEQVGFNIRFQNQQYIDNLQAAGDKSRLDNELEFKKQLAKTVMADQQSILNNQRVFEQVIAADGRQFAQELADMDLDYAIQVADDTIRAASTRQVVSGVGGLVSGGLEAAGSSGLFNSKTNNSPGASGAALSTEAEQALKSGGQ